ncbi:MAG: TetR family transcriptional regulator [Streptosporangiales bacterium]|nr:TetR family transcriptional regulator [Streptosporangiales bacterium]
MNSSASSGPAPLSRRQEYRQATIEEIKGLARCQLAEHGPGALSLRAIARDMRMASSALYRYFASYDDLITALCVDAYNSVADALTQARDARPADDHAGRWWAICHAHRRWALDNPADFALIFGTPVPGYQAPARVTGPAAGRLAAALFDVYAAAAHARAARPDRTQVPEKLEVGELLTELLPEAGAHHPPRLAGIAATAWASVLGYLVAEIFGSLTRLIPDTDQLYDAHLRTVMLGMGFDPDLIQAAGRDEA